MLFDLAFLLMDLDHRDRRKDANMVLNRYLDVTADDDGLAALPLFLSERAAIRAHVDGVAAKSQRDPALAEAQRQEARDYLARAVDYVKPPPAALVAIGGLSGTGKSALARALAPSPPRWAPRRAPASCVRTFCANDGSAFRWIISCPPPPTNQRRRRPLTGRCARTPRRFSRPGMG